MVLPLLLVSNKIIELINNMFSDKQLKADKEKGSAGWGSNPHILQSGQAPYPFGPTLH